jgi:transcriptional regulator GlxA family with amidase domain
MRRRQVMAGMAGVLAASGLRAAEPTRGPGGAARAAGPLRPPAKGKIPVAFLISEGATVIDFAGPWEVFQDVHVESRGASMDEMMPFELFMVAETPDVVTASAGMRLVPQYTFQNVPAPKVVVVGAQSGRSAATLEWLRQVSRSADVTMSVCTGAFLLGRAGLLAGREATTHHDFYDQFERQFPDVRLRRGLRFVEGPGISTSGGLTSGIDLAIRVVERYFGRAVAANVARYMEHQSEAWKV